MAESYVGEPARAGHLDIWLAAQREPESDRYNITVDLEFAPTVDVPALRAAFGDVLGRHPALRSRFRTEDGNLERQVLPDPPAAFVTEYRETSYDRAVAREWAVTAGRAPFDLTSAPLARAALLINSGGALLALTMHHIVADGWATTVLAEDLVACYRARLSGEAIAPPAPVHAESPAPVPPNESLSAPLVPLPDLISESGAAGPSACVRRPLPADVVTAARELATEAGSSPAGVMLSAWSILVRAWDGGAEGTVGVVFSGRADGEEELVDLRSRVVPVSVGFADSADFLTVLGGSRDQLLDAFEFAHLPADRTRPVERSVFMYTPAYEACWEVPGGTVRRFDHADETTKHEFSTNVVEGESGTTLCVYYDSARYTGEAAELFATQLVSLLGNAVAAPSTSCAELLAGCDCGARCDEGAPADPTWTIPELVLRQAEQRPGAVAIRHGTQTASYIELVRRAAAVAGWLRAKGIGEGDTVALLLRPGVDVPACWLGAALAGVAYVPLDPAYPTARLQLIVDDVRPAALVVSPGSIVDVLLEEGHYATTEELFSAEEPADVRTEWDPAATFCVLYTSGTTGDPKGVVLPHRGLARLMNRPDFLALDHTDVLAQVCPLNFDGAAYEIWGALAHGGQVVIFDKHLVLSPKEMRSAVRAHGVTTLVVTTPLLHRIIEDAPDLLQSLRAVYFGGELISVGHMRKALRWCRPGVLLHSYGPTENSFTSTWHPITEVAANARTVSIGKPVPGTEVRVVMRDGETPAPRGVPGDLLLGGIGLADGYLGASERTEEKFTDIAGRRLYRTGDRVRWTPDGLLEFIGREDNQVKIRSQRVELGEVEAVLDTHPAVRAAFVTARHNHRGEQEIVGYVVTEDGLDPGDIRAHVRSRLPEFAVPAHIVVTTELPVTATGKIDRARLPAPSPRVAERSRDEFATVRSAWSAVLGHQDFGPEQNFFDVGGHSLLLVRLQEELRRTSGIALPVVELMTVVTVRGQAALLGVDAVQPQPDPPARRAAPAAVRPPARQPDGGARVLVLSTATAEALPIARQRLATHLATHECALEDLTHTLLVGRESLAHRMAFVVTDIAQARRALEDGPVYTGEADGEQKITSQLTSLDELARAWCQGAEVTLPSGGNRIRLPVHPLSWARDEFVNDFTDIEETTSAVPAL